MDDSIVKLLPQPINVFGIHQTHTHPPMSYENPSLGHNFSHNFKSTLEQAKVRIPGTQLSSFTQKSVLHGELFKLPYDKSEPPE